MGVIKETCVISGCGGPAQCWKNQEGQRIKNMPTSDAKTAAEKHFSSSTDCTEDTNRKILAAQAEQGYTGSDVPESSK